MRICYLAPVLFLFCDSAGLADDPPPPGEPPRLWRASAVEKDGEVIIQITRPEYVTPRRAVFPEVMKWKSLRPATLGKSAQVFRANGEPMKPNAVLMALAKPKGLAVLVQYSGDELMKPHPFYLAMLHEDTCVLVVAADAVLDLRP